MHSTHAGYTKTAFRNLRVCCCMNLPPSTSHTSCRIRQQNNKVSSTEKNRSLFKVYFVLPRCTTPIFFPHFHRRPSFPTGSIYISLSDFPSLYFFTPAGWQSSIALRIARTSINTMALKLLFFRLLWRLPFIHGTIYTVQVCSQNIYHVNSPPLYGTFRIRNYPEKNKNVCHLSRNLNEETFYSFKIYQLPYIL